MTESKEKNPLIVALDVESAAEARLLVGKLRGVVDFYKVGMELYAAEGMGIVRELIGGGSRVFLDLKLYDIGETVKRATARVASVGVKFLTVHGSNAVLRAAAEGRGSAALELLAVTVLTSYDQQDLAELGYVCTLGELVALRVKNAMSSGIDGIVCSALEAPAVRSLAGARATIVTPGVRSKWAQTGDQKRVATPAEAMAAGANYLVIGRQVTRAQDPRGEAQKILGELAGAVLA